MNQLISLNIETGKRVCTNRIRRIIRESKEFHYYYLILENAKKTRQFNVTLIYESKEDLSALTYDYTIIHGGENKAIDNLADNE